MAETTLAGVIDHLRPGGTGPTVAFYSVGSRRKSWFPGTCTCGASHQWWNRGHHQWTCEACGTLWHQTFHVKDVPVLIDPITPEQQRERWLERSRAGWDRMARRYGGDRMTAAYGPRP